VAINIWVQDPEALRKRGSASIVWGIVLAALGVVVLSWPDITGSVLVRLVGVCITACGFVLVYGSWSLRRGPGRTWIAALVPSIAIAIFGAIVFFWPGAIGQVLLAIVALLAIAAGLFDVVLSFSIISIMHEWWVRLVRGLVIAGAGIWMIASHVSGLAAIGMFLGIWALLVGVITTAFGIMAKRI
jgi:uncharacterized membrane protein HdeD (DUF308 family)